MSWRYVISDNNCQPGSDMNDFVKVVLATGYKFFTWNGMVYGLGTNNEPFDTGFLADTLQ